VPRYAERSFLLSIDGFRVSGRIDAIYGEDDGPWEVVDWKTGRKPEDDPLAALQLDLYGLACIDIWHKRPEELTLTYLYLASDEEVSHPMGEPEEVRAQVARVLKAISVGEFEPTPGPWCTHCDFRAFCDAGSEWLSRALA
jgi:CRISPR/Cas system-associated exonuclease Cas4 (RecB family)